MKAGKVYIIGVGPGDYKLITLKAVECIEKADVVVYDRLIGKKVLKYVKNGTELIYAGKMPDHHALPQEEINKLLVEKASEGKIVARVKGGDPFLFGRGGEEAEYIRQNQIEFEVVPGITSAIAAPAYAGIPVTHRDYSSSLHIITGHEKSEKTQGEVDYRILSKIQGTLIFLMGVKNIYNICRNLIEEGKDGHTPAAVIEKGTTGEQRIITGTLEDIAQKADEAGIVSPAVVVIGSVAALEGKLGWFPKGVLAGKKVIVTRAREQASSLVERIEELGGEVLEFPTIKIVEPENFDHFDRVLDGVWKYNWLVFTSTNGVNAFFERMRYRNIDIRSLMGIKLCAVGQSTARELNKLALNVDYIPQKFTTRDLLKGLTNLVMPGEKVLLARTDIAGKELEEGLIASAVDVESLIVYRTVADSVDMEEAVELLKKGGIDFITFTSSSTVRNFVSIIGRDKVKSVCKAKVICIGPVTEETAKELGIGEVQVADVHTIDGVVNKILENV